MHTTQNDCGHADMRLNKARVHWLSVLIRVLWFQFPAYCASGMKERRLQPLGVQTQFRRETEIDMIRFGLHWISFWSSQSVTDSFDSFCYWVCSTDTVFFGVCRLVNLCLIINCIRNLYALWCLWFVFSSSKFLRDERSLLIPILPIPAFRLALAILWSSSV